MDLSVMTVRLEGEGCVGEFADEGCYWCHYLDLF